MASTLWRISRLVRRPPTTGALARLQPQQQRSEPARSNPTWATQSQPVVTVSSSASPARPTERLSLTQQLRLMATDSAAGSGKEPVTENRLNGLTEGQLEALARQLARGSAPGDVVFLKGDLGAGKSTFARAFIRELMCDPKLSVTSPTFVIEQIYNCATVDVHHMDLYRLEGPKDVQHLGLHRAFDTAVCLVEWPDRLGRLMPTRRLDVEVTYSRTDDELRDVRLRAVGEGWAARVEAAVRSQQPSVPGTPALRIPFLCLAAHSCRRSGLFNHAAAVAAASPSATVTAATAPAVSASATPAAAAAASASAVPAADSPLAAVARSAPVPVPGAVESASLAAAHLDYMSRLVAARWAEPARAAAAPSAPAVDAAAQAAAPSPAAAAASASRLPSSPPLESGDACERMALGDLLHALHRR